MHVGFVGEFGAARVSPRSLLAACQGHLVSVEGIVTKASIVRPKWVKSVHYCAATGKELTREYRFAAAAVCLKQHDVKCRSGDCANMTPTAHLIILSARLSA